MSSSSDVPAPQSTAHTTGAAPQRQTPVTEYNVPMVSPGSIDSVASMETIRPAITAPGTTRSWFTILVVLLCRRRFTFLDLIII